MQLLATDNASHVMADSSIPSDSNDSSVMLDHSFDAKQLKILKEIQGSAEVLKKPTDGDENEKISETVFVSQSFSVQGMFLNSNYVKIFS